MVERNICHRKSNKAVIKQLRIEKHLFFFFSFSATSFINFSHSEHCLGKVGFDAESIVFFTFFCSIASKVDAESDLKRCGCLFRI